MPRRARIVIPGLPHHVYDRGNNRRRLFSYSTDRKRFLKCLADGLTVGRCTLHQLTLMTNHVHMIVTPESEDGLSIMMKRCKQRYGQLRNQRRSGSGSLFEARFKSKPIVAEEHLMAATLYNDANAFRAGLSHSGTTHEWSTGPLHAARPDSMIPPDMWTPSPWYLGLGSTPRERGVHYEALMVGYLSSSPEPPACWAIDPSVEDADVEPYKKRTERPDGSSAREPTSSRLFKKK